MAISGDKDFSNIRDAVSRGYFIYFIYFVYPISKYLNTRMLAPLLNAALCLAGWRLVAVIFAIRPRYGSVNGLCFTLIYVCSLQNYVQ